MSVLVQKYNFDCHLCGVKPGSLKYAEGVQKQGTEEATWTQVEGCNRSVDYYEMKSFIYRSSHQILQQNSFRLLTEFRNPDNSALKRE
jgi:hypothetical protein